MFLRRSLPLEFPLREHLWRPGQSIPHAGQGRWIFWCPSFLGVKTHSYCPAGKSHGKFPDAPQSKERETTLSPSHQMATLLNSLMLADEHHRTGGHVSQGLTQRIWGSHFWIPNWGSGKVIPGTLGIRKNDPWDPCFENVCGPSKARRKHGNSIGRVAK